MSSIVINKQQNNKYNYNMDYYFANVAASLSIEQFCAQAGHALRTEYSTNVKEDYHAVHRC